MAKAYEYSPKTRAEKTGSSVKELVMRALDQGTPMSASEIMDHLVKSAEYKGGITAIQNNFGALSRSGIISEAIETDVVSGRAQKLFRYSVVH